MKIALDFDGTFTEDPSFWKNFIDRTLSSGHEVIMCTFRSSDQTHKWLEELAQTIPVYFTSGQQKKTYMNSLDLSVDVWIDDQPELII